jgi:hypothetical protein
MDHDVTLEMLYARCEAARHAHPDDDAWLAHAAVLDRLAANRRIAEAAGWTSCALEREGDAGRFRLIGVPPGTGMRTEVPDWSGSTTARDEPAQTGARVRRTC